MRTLVIHEMYEVLRRHSATVRFRRGARPRHNRDDPYFPAAMRQAPPVRFPVSYLHFSLPLVISPAPKFTFHVVASVSTVSPSTAPRRLLTISLPAPPAHDPPTSRRLYIASGEILLLGRIRGVPIETNRFAKCRWHDWNGSQSVVVNIGRPFSIYFRCYGTLATLISEPIREAEIDGHALNFLYERAEKNYPNIKRMYILRDAH